MPPSLGWAGLETNIISTYHMFVFMFVIMLMFVFVLCVSEIVSVNKISQIINKQNVIPHNFILSLTS